jgi:F0F1-type ATP synthase beta subunit
MELCYSCQFNKSIISSILCVVESSANANPYPNHLFIKNTSAEHLVHKFSNIRLWNTTIISCYSLYSLKDTIIYIAYLYLNIEHSVGNMMHTSISLNIISSTYSTDTLNAQIKPIHKTPVALLSFCINLRLFSTGIKVVDLLLIVVSLYLLVKIR